MTSRGRSNLTFKGRQGEDDSGRPWDIIRTSSRGPLKHVIGTTWDHQLNVPTFPFIFLFELI